MFLLHSIQSQKESSKVLWSTYFGEKESDIVEYWKIKKMYYTKDYNLVMVFSLFWYKWKNSLVI